MAPRVKFLSPEQQAQAVAVGDFGTLAESYLPLVRRIAADFARKYGQPFDELEASGAIGLVLAAKKYDPVQASFSHYASFWIKAYIFKFIIDNWRLVKIGTTQAQRKLFYKLNKERQQLLAQGLESDDDTLAEILGVSVEEVSETGARLGGVDVSLDVCLEEDGSPLIEFFPRAETDVEAEVHCESVKRLTVSVIAQAGLTSREKEILARRWLTEDPETLDSIAQTWEITRERVRQIEAKAFAKIRPVLEDYAAKEEISW